MTLGSLPTRKQILANFGALLSGMGLARLMTAAALILVARQVGPDNYGQYLACFSLAKLTSVAFSWGLDGWLLWRGGSATDRAMIAVQSGIALSWKLVLGGAWLVLLYLLARLLNPEVFPAPVLLITALIVWTDDLTNTVWSVFKSTLRNDVTFKIITSVQFFMLIVTVGLVAAGIEALVPFLWSRFIVSAAGCVTAILMLRHSLGISFDASGMWPTFRAATPFAASLVLALIYERADVAIVGQFLGTSQAGLYGPAATIATTLFLIPGSAYAVMVPVFARAHAIQATTFSRTLRLFLTINSAVGLCLASILALSADWIVQQLYGHQYAGSAGVLAILSLVLGIRCITFALGAAVVGTGQQVRRLYVQALAAGLNVAMNLAVVNLWGIQGVAWVYVVSELVLLIGYWLVLRPVSGKTLTQTSG